ncbi:MAG: hypothetical protein AAGA48_23485 [Myxococcota bacterium]
MRTAVFLTLALACNVDSADPTDTSPQPPPAVLPEVPTETKTETGPGCDYFLASSDPFDGETDVFYRDDVVMQVTEAPPSAQIVVSDRDGTVIPGTTTIEKLDVRWSGDPMTPNTFHRATLVIEGCDDQAVEFLVSTTGMPAGNVSGSTYEVDLTSGVWTEPPGIGAVIGTLIPTDALFLSPQIDGPDLSMTAAFVDMRGEQAWCLPTIPFPTAPYDDPYFEAVTQELSFEILDTEVSLGDVSLTGAFAPNGGRIDAMALSGTLDVRDVEDFLAGLDLCAVVAEAGAACFACPDSVVACVALTVEDLDATLAGDVTVVERTLDDIESDPTCVAYGS